jgi:hypothetical protein
MTMKPELRISLNTHHAEGLEYPKVRGQKKVTEFGYPRARRFRKYQIENRSPELPQPPSYVKLRLDKTV